MGDLTDELLMAFADGQLSTAEASEVEAALKTRPDLKARVAIYRATGRNLGTVYDEARLAPIPDKLVDAIRNAPGPGAKLNGTDATVTILDEVRASKRGKRAGFMGRNWSLAASVVALAGAAAAVLAVVKANDPTTSGLAEMVTFDNKPLFRTAALFEVLEGQAARDPVSIAGAASERWLISPAVTFKARDQRFCRSYTAASTATAGLQIEGLGCRRSDGRWTIEAQAEPVAATGSPGQVSPASGPSPAIVGAIERIRGGEILDAAEVKRVIANGWKDPQK